MLEMKATREAFGEALRELGKENRKVVVVSGDLEDATRAEYFKKEFPERFFNIGISEQDMLGTCVGLSLDGFIPFAASFGVFLTNSAYGIMRISICYNKRNVKLIGSHTGLTVGADGATAQCLEDFAITRVLPNMIVLCPVDALETRKATKRISEICGPVYMRLGRAPYPIITKEEDIFEIGKAACMRDGGDVTVIGCGLMVSESIKAAGILAGEGIETRVVNMHTIKPIDEEMIVRCARETGAIVTAEEHQINGGLGGAVAEVLARNYPVPQEMIAVRDTFGESGDPEGLLRKYHLKDVDIARAARAAIARKR